MPHLIETLESRQLFATGLPDTSFGGSTSIGTVAFRSDTANDRAVPVKLLVDGGGRSYVVARTSGIVQVRRLTREGVLDPTYANARGLIGLPVSTTLTAAPGAGATASTSTGGIAAALDPADRLYLLAGNQIYRFTVSGKIDPTFGTKGVATLSGFSGAKDIDVDAFNRIVVSGSAATGSGTTASEQFVVARLRSNGSYDRTFATNGVYTVPLPTYPSLKSTAPYARGEFVRVLDDSSVVAVGSARRTLTDGEQRANPYATGVESVHLTAAGAVDTAYGVNGLALELVNGDDVTYRREAPVGIRADGSVVTLTSVSSVDSDRSTATNGLITRTGSRGHSYFVNTAARTVSLGTGATFDTAPGGGELIDDTAAALLYRTKADGTLDTDFTSTAANYPIGGVGGIALSPDGTILTVGRSSKALSLNVRRLFADATPVANLAAKPITAQGSANAAFSVTYASPAGFNTSTTNGSELRFTTPAGVVRTPQVVGRTVINDSIVVRYQGLTGALLNSSNNGTYLIDLVGTGAQDLAGNSPAARRLGTLTIAIA